MANTAWKLLRALLDGIAASEDEPEAELVAKETIELAARSVRYSSATSRRPTRATQQEAWVKGGFGDDSWGHLRCVVTDGANRQPAVACYVKRAGDTDYRPLALDVLRIEDEAVAEIAVFPLSRCWRRLAFRGRSDGGPARFRLPGGRGGGNGADLRRGRMAGRARGGHPRRDRARVRRRRLVPVRAWFRPLSGRASAASAPQPRHRAGRARRRLAAMSFRPPARLRGGEAAREAKMTEDEVGTREEWLAARNAGGPS